ncbi:MULTISPECIES: tyrosine-type recombinase/integrase [unclassified Brenneria]|uniref:tyrosine-type recombinase/integrase n=1 Tax=unclassified Brenneria TaxID=2634434 RepID=UPI0018F08DF7|nr:integrase arm-type DNA-binding domain-containing protein [Brenneria sp. L3-3C-1]MBJ7223488.1 tyrosine-type recombinase/integrase [Brenneria sp. L3-3C-1]MEE3644728.1 integrase arm-type DNA-binding domain-containing protein [Brenneria sp. L3_3C_1]
MALSDMAVRQAKATGKAYTLGDLDGLSLAVTDQGGRSWHFRYCWAGKQKRMSLGTYPEITLREARALRDQARALLAKGINPKLDRKQKRRAVRLADEHTFKAVFLQWVEHRRLELKEGRNSTLSQILRIFDRDVLPSLGKTAMYDIRRTDLLDVVAKIEQRKAFTTAEKVRTWFNQLFRFALVKVEGLETNPASDLDVVAVPPPPVTHNPFLRLPQVPELLQKLRRYRGAITTQLGIRLLLLTGVRTGELRLATPDQFVLDQGLWIIPPEVVKQLQTDMRKKGIRPQDVPPYIVPLSVQAIEVVRYLLAEFKPAQRYLLPHRSDLKERISENTLNGALKRMGYKDLLTGHGIRGTISTALNEVGYPKIWVDAQLSHSDPNQVSAAYNHALYVEPRRRMMQDWADRLDLLEQGEVATASAHLTIRIDGVPLLEESGRGTADEREVTPPPAMLPVMAGVPPVHRLSAVPARPVPEPVVEVAVSDLQRERMEMLATYEAPHNLPVAQFAKLAGKSKDQINREIKAGKLLTISIGNRGQRVPEWQLDPLKQRLVQSVMERLEGMDPWQLYRALLQPRESLGGSAVEVVSAANLHESITAVCYDLMSRNAPLLETA